jgi:MFS family permease
MEVWRDPSLAPLFILSIAAGFSMFSTLVYAPLLFQGGFAMTPQQAGLLITPLVACITVASLANSRLVTRVPHPNLMLYIGFILMALSSLCMALMERTSSSGFMLTTMLLGGLGFGLVLPNLTIFAQQTAPRAHLGIATALLQSLRMRGGMLGTAVTGTLVNRMYSSGVQRTLELENGQQWQGAFHNPEILMDAASQQKLLAETMQSGHDGAAMLNAAREALVSAIHMGMALAIVMALVGLWMSRRVPRVSFSRPMEPAAPVE